MKKMQYNRGEWAEAYAFVKLIGDGQVYASDEKLNINYDKIYPILKVFKNEIKRCYETDPDEGIVTIVSYNGDIVCSLRTSDFIDIAKNSVNIIKAGTKGKNVIKGEKQGTFEVPIMNDFLNKIGIEKFKASSKEKTDIIMEIWDDTTYSRNKLNFSIKSFLGGKPTLMNPSGRTLFTFKVNGMSEDDRLYLNSINKETAGDAWKKDKFGKIYDECRAGNYDVTWVDEKNNMLYQNLRLIDSSLPEILSHMLFYFYSHKDSSPITLLTEKLIILNPLNLADEEKDVFYKKKIIEYIKACAFGMRPSERWNANNEINGGLLTVKKDGNIVCHHILYDYNSLENYLYKNTKLDSPGSGKHKYGELFKKGDDIFFQLSLQLRYK